MNVLWSIYILKCTLFFNCLPVVLGFSSIHKESRTLVTRPISEGRVPGWCVSSWGSEQAISLILSTLSCHPRIRWMILDFPLIEGLTGNPPINLVAACWIWLCIWACLLASLTSPATFVYFLVRLAISCSIREPHLYLKMFIYVYRRGKFMNKACARSSQLNTALVALPGIGTFFLLRHNV